MNSDRLQGEWKQMKGLVKVSWRKLTYNDVDIINGRSDQLVKKLHETYGVGEAEAQRQVDEWLHSSGHIIIK